MLQRELKNKDFAKKITEIGLTVLVECPGDVSDTLKARDFALFFTFIFNVKSISSKYITQTLMFSTIFFHAESESGNGFSLSRPDFAGLLDSIVVYGPDLATLKIRYWPPIGEFLTDFKNLFLQNLCFLILLWSM